MTEDDKSRLTPEAAAVSENIRAKANYEFKQKINSTLRYDGTAVMKTERTPAVRAEFREVFAAEIIEQLKCDPDDERINMIIDDAFERIVTESSADFIEYKAKTNQLVKFIYLLAFIIIVLAAITYALGWTVKM